MSRPPPPSRRPWAAARDSGPSRDLGRKQQLLRAGPALSILPLLPTLLPSRDSLCYCGVQAAARLWRTRVERGDRRGARKPWIWKLASVPEPLPTQVQPVSHGSLVCSREIRRFGGRLGRSGKVGVGPWGVAAAQRSPEGAVAAQTRVWLAQAPTCLPFQSQPCNLGNTDRLHAFCLKIWLNFIMLQHVFLPARGNQGTLRNPNSE